MKIHQSGELGLSAKPTKTPWFLRLAGAVKPKEVAATAGFAVIYGLLFAGLLFAPLLPHLAAQSNSPTNNSPTNSVPIPTDHPTGLGDFDNASSEADCLKILNDKKEARRNKFEEAKKKARAAYAVCETNRNNSLELNEANLQVAYQTAENAADGLFWSCLGFGGGPATATAAAGSSWIVKIRGGSVAVSRFIGGLAGAVVLVGSLAACKSLANDDEAKARAAAKEVKRIQDKTAWDRFNQCYDANYAPLNDKANKIRARYFRHRKVWERQYRQCVEFFEDQEDENQDGNCATTD